MESSALLDAPLSSNTNFFRCICLCFYFFVLEKTVINQVTNT